MYDELVYYDQSTDIAYREDQSQIANENLPEWKYKLNKTIGVQFLDSNSVDANGDFDDFSDESVTVSSSSAIDNNNNHYEDGAANLPYTNAGGPYDEIEITSITGPFRAVGRFRFTNATGQQDVVNYRGVTGTGPFTFQTADVDFDIASWTPVNDYAIDDVARYVEEPIMKDSTVDTTNKATGLFETTLNANNLIYQELIEDNAEIEGCSFEIQLLDGSAEIIKAKEFRVKCIRLLDDGGEVAPAPESSYSTTTEANALYDLYGKHYVSISIDSTSLGDTNIQTISASKRFLPLEVIPVLDSLSGAGTPPSFKIKVDTTDVMTAQAVDMTVAQKVNFFGLNADEFFAAASILKVEITNAATYTTYNVTFIVKGVLLDA